MAGDATYIFSIFILTVFSVTYSCCEDGTFAITVPNVRPHLPEVFLCTPVKLNNSSDYYIVKFEPKAAMETVHHMVVYGCLSPGSKKPLWSCNESKGRIAEREYGMSAPCDSKPIVMYAWAKNASTLHLPPEVGFKVGGNTTIQYLVMQIHFAITDNVNDKSTSISNEISSFPRLVLHYTQKRMSKLAGVFFLGSTGRIPPKSTEHWDSACLIVENKTMHPFAFRVHAHHFGTVVSGYRVRPDSNGTHQWTLIGKKDPQKPHMFYPVANNITITKGDTIAARCSYYNHRTTPVYSGSTDDDEMCNFYVMYYVDEGEPLTMKYCWTPGSPFYYWDSELNNIPPDASVPE